MSSFAILHNLIQNLAPLTQKYPILKEQPLSTLLSVMTVNDTIAVHFIQAALSDIQTGTLTPAVQSFIDFAHKNPPEATTTFEQFLLLHHPTYVAKRCIIAKALDNLLTMHPHSPIDENDLFSGLSDEEIAIAFKSSQYDPQWMNSDIDLGEFEDLMDQSDFDALMTDLNQADINDDDIVPSMPTAIASSSFPSLESQTPAIPALSNPDIDMGADEPWMDKPEDSMRDDSEQMIASANASTTKRDLSTDDILKLFWDIPLNDLNELTTAKWSTLFDHNGTDEGAAHELEELSRYQSGAHSREILTPSTMAPTPSINDPKDAPEDYDTRVSDTMQLG